MAWMFASTQCKQREAPQHMRLEKSLRLRRFNDVNRPVTCAALSDRRRRNCKNVVVVEVGE